MERTIVKKIGDDLYEISHLSDEDIKKIEEEREREERAETGIAALGLGALLFLLFVDHCSKSG